MKQTLIFFSFVFLLFGCNNKKNELNYISFKISNDSIKTYMEEAIVLLDKMDYGSGTSLFWIDGKLHYPAYKSKGFNIVELNGNKSSFPTLHPLNHNESIKLFELIEIFNSNGINSLGKSSDNIYSFEYKQRELNPHNEYKQNRSLVYLTSNTDTTIWYFQNSVILDRYKNIILTAPKEYDEPKLPMDEESIMKRAEEYRKKREQKMKQEQE